MSSNNINSNNKPIKNDECYAFCPECGTDLYYANYECICKNKNCNWLCTNCKDSKNK